MNRIHSWLRNRVARMVALLCAGVLVLSGCDFSVYSLPLPGGADLGDNPYAVKVQFRDVLDLVPQSAVKVDDVTVGTVDDIRLDGYTAEVTVLLREDVELPDNAEAKIRQTSLLGEKFVSLGPPSTGASDRLLGEGDLIPLERSGRNPEVEEVLGAMSLLLNGGGVAQLKTIAVEFGDALEGREANVKSVLDQLDLFMSQIDDNKDDILQAIESLNRLSIELNKQKRTIDLALDELPAALASVNRQRDDLVTMLEALSDLSSIGTQVIRDSKAATIDSLDALAPTLTKLAEAGEALPNSLQVFWTYPFVDAVVGENPAQARNLHMGDYTNLSVKLDADLTGLPGGNQGPITETLCEELGLPVGCSPDQICAEAPNNPICDELGPIPETLTKVERCIRSGDPDSKACDGVTLRRLKEACAKPDNKDTAFCRAVLAVPDPGGSDDPGLPPLPDPTDLPLPGTGGLLRPGFGDTTSGAGLRTSSIYDGELAPLLMWGLMQR